MALTLEEAVRELQREYKRKWQANNPEKVKAYRRRYWEKKARALIEQNGKEAQINACADDKKSDQ